MPLLRSCLLVALTTISFHLPAVVECRRDNWYPRTCTTGYWGRLTYDDVGNTYFSYGDTFVPEGNFTGTQSDNNTDSGGGRWLRRSVRNLDAAEFVLSNEGVSSSSSTALPWIRQTQQQPSDGWSPYNMTMLPSAQRNFSHMQAPKFVRPCLCRPNPDFYAPNETVPDLYLCPISASYCGIPLPGTGPVVCFSVTVQEVVAVNAWPIVLLWYLGLVLICCCTIHGKTTMDFCRSLCNPQWNRHNVNRILAARNPSMPQPPPSSQWHVWAWQNYRFEQNLLAQTRMILRFQDFTREQLRREQGLPPPSYEMKTKRYSKDDHCHTDDHDHHGDDNDSIHEPACTICFVPLEDGDIVGDLACQHIFHKACLKSWCTRKNACPLCNTILATRRPDPQPQDMTTTPQSNHSD